MKREWLMSAGFVLAALALWLMLREEREERRGATSAAPDTASVSGTSVQSNAAEKARRAAIAALGPPKPDVGNRADFYRQAMRLYEGLTQKETEMLKDTGGDLHGKEAASLYAKIQPIMDLLRQARNSDYVDWGMGPVSVENMQGKNAVFRSIYDLGKLAVWDSAYRLQSDADGAIGDLVAAEDVGRAGDDTLVGFFNCIGIHEAAVNLIAQNSGSVTSAAQADLASIVSPLALQESFQSAMVGMASTAQATLDGYANPLTRGVADKILRQLADLDQDGTDPSTTPEEDVLPQLKWLEQTEQQLAGTLGEPDVQFQQWWALKNAEAASMPLANRMLVALGSARTTAQVGIVQSTMLAAGMTLEQGSQAQFQAIADPGSGHPFTYTQTASGFELGSTILLGGKPVNLTFSTSAK